MKLTREDESLLAAVCEGSWWAALRLAYIVDKPREAVSLALQRLKRRGLVEADGYLWRASQAGRTALANKEDR